MRRRAAPLALRLLAICVLACAAATARAQGVSDGALMGRVLEDWNTPLIRPVGAAGVVLEITSLDDGSIRRVRTARDGSFAVLDLAPGQYRVAELLSGAAHGLRSVTLDEVSVEAGEVADVMLRLPASSQAVANNPLEAGATGDFDAGQIVSLPIDTRDWEGLAALEPELNDASGAGSDDVESARADGNSSETAQPGGVSESGLPLFENVETLDGLSAQQNFFSGVRGAGGSSGSGVAGSSFSQSAVRAFRVAPRTYSAAFGNGAGAMLGVASRRAGDAVHGGAFGLLRESGFAATNPYSVVTQYQDGAITSSVAKPDDTMTQAGGHMGLPLGNWIGGRWKHRLALFGSFEAQLRDDPVIATPDVATFYALTPMQVSLLANRGVTATATNAALNYLDSLTGTVQRSSLRELGFVRLDDSPGQRDRVTLTYAGNRVDAPAGTGYGSASDAVMDDGRASVGDSLVRLNAASAQWTHAFTARSNNQLRFQYVRDAESEAPRAPLPQEPAISPGGFAPEVSIQPDGFTFGTPANLGRAAYPDEHRVELTDTFELLRGRHLFTAGGDWSRINDRIASYINPDGTFVYDSGTTGGHAGGLVDWITDYTFNVHAYPNGGCPSITAAVHYACFHSYTQSFGPAQTQFVTHDFAGFAEDRIRLRDNLTLTLGARYEYALLPFPQTPNLVLDAGLLTAGTQLRGATASFPEDRNNIGPRLALSWSPRRVLTAHLGYGLFFGRLTGAEVRSALADTALASTTTQVRITPTTTTDCPQVGMQGFGYPCAFVAAPPAAVAATSSAMLFASNFRLPAVQRASLTVERNLGRHGFLRAGYAMAITTQLPGSLDLNIASATQMASFVLQGGDGHPGLHSGETFAVPLYTARRLSEFGPVTALVSNANATYHAATLEAELRNWRGLELRGNFTFSRSIDYGPQLSATPRTDSQFDPFANGYDKGLSSLQFPARFSGVALWRPRLEHGPAAVRSTFNGWRVAAIATAGSGAPYSYEIYGGTYLSGGHDSINGSGGAAYLPTVGRNTLRLPARGNVNLRLERGFALRREVRLSGFAEAFNLLNERNLSTVETRAFVLGTSTTGAPTPLVFQDAPTIAAEGLNTPAFGTPLSSSAGLSRERQAELGLRLEF